MMKKVAAAAAAASGLIFAGAGVAAADQGTAAVAGGAHGIGSGNIISVPVNVPVEVVGNTVTVLGSMNSSTARPAPAAETAPRIR